MKMDKENAAYGKVAKGGILFLDAYVTVAPLWDFSKEKGMFYNELV